MNLLAKIEDRTADVCVVGLGYVGLPMVMSLVRAGFRVHGLDKDQEKVAALAKGECYLEHVDPEAVKECVDTGRVWTYASVDALPKCDVFLICVPTPVDASKYPDMRAVNGAVADVARVAEPGSLVVLESTVAPGTTRACAQKYKPGVLAAFSPEREDPGNEHYWTQNTPKLVGALDDAALMAAVGLYEAVCNEVVPVESPEVAEMAKLFENTFRFVNIALVNELKQVCQAMGLDPWQVVQAAGTKPFGFKAFWPGPGIGGHCCPVDCHYYRWKAVEHGVETRLVNAAAEVNDETPFRVVDAVVEHVEVGGRVLVVGLAYKRGVGDVRESPALEVVLSLMEAGRAVTVHDPYVGEVEKIASGLGVDVTTDLDEKVVGSADAVVVLTDHRDRVDWSLVLDNARLVLDTRGFLDKNKDNVKRI